MTIDHRRNWPQADSYGCLATDFPGNLGARSCNKQYVKSAQNHKIELVTMNGYVHNLFTESGFDAIVSA